MILLSVILLVVSVLSQGIWTGPFSECGGGDLVGFGNIPTLAECQSGCESYDGCLFITYGGSTCIYKSGLTSVHSCTGCDSTSGLCMNTGGCDPNSQYCGYNYMDAVDCVGSWSSCSNGDTCEQTYSISTPAANGGTSCPVADASTQYCSNDAGCAVSGCTDTEADNYSAAANQDDGSCTYNTGYKKIGEGFCRDKDGEHTWTVELECDVSIDECHVLCDTYKCQCLSWASSITELNDGCEAGNSRCVIYYDGPLPDSSMLFEPIGELYYTYQTPYDPVGVPGFGCMDPAAENYNSAATVDDKSCTIPGCIYPAAENYNSAATSNDGSCTFLTTPTTPGDYCWEYSHPGYWNCCYEYKGAGHTLEACQAFCESEGDFECVAVNHYESNGECYTYSDADGAVDYTGGMAYFKSECQACEVWEEELSDWYCDGTAVEDVAMDQCKCQQICEGTDGCMGISITHKKGEAYSQQCWICSSEKELAADDLGFSFYRIPGGCTDPNAANYDSTAEKDNGSCLYEYDGEPFVHWGKGQLGESCSQYCAGIGQLCNLQEMKAYKKYDLEYIFGDISECDNKAQQPWNSFPHTPSTSGSTCSYNNDATTCDGSDSSAMRFCACTPEPCDDYSTAASHCDQSQLHICPSNAANGDCTDASMSTWMNNCCKQSCGLSCNEWHLIENDFCKDDITWRDESGNSCSDLQGTDKCQAHGEYSVEATSACPVTCDACGCENDPDWTDYEYGSGTWDCNDIAANKEFCKDFGQYSIEAQKNCPQSCGTCRDDSICEDSVIPGLDCNWGQDGTNWCAWMDDVSSNSANSNAASKGCCDCGGGASTCLDHKACPDNRYCAIGKSSNGVIYNSCLPIENCVGANDSVDEICPCAYAEEWQGEFGDCSSYFTWADNSNWGAKCYTDSWNGIWAINACHGCGSCTHKALEDCSTCCKHSDCSPGEYCSQGVNYDGTEYNECYPFESCVYREDAINNECPYTYAGHCYEWKLNGFWNCNYSGYGGKLETLLECMEACDGYGNEGWEGKSCTGFTYYNKMCYIYDNEDLSSCETTSFGGYKAYAKTSDCTEVPDVEITLETGDVHWGIAPLAFSCDDYCESFTGTTLECNLDAMQSYENSDLESVFGEIPQCKSMDKNGEAFFEWYYGMNLAADPQMYANNECYFSNDKTTCDASWWDGNRFCACSPVTIEADESIWKMGEMGESCDAVCEGIDGLGLECNLEAIKSYDVNDWVDYFGSVIPNAINHCDKKDIVNEQAYYSTPGTWWSYCSFNYEHATCAGSDSHTKRFCACSLPVVVSSVTVEASLSIGENDDKDDAMTALGEGFASSVGALSGDVTVSEVSSGRRKLDQSIDVDMTLTTTDTELADSAVASASDESFSATLKENTEAAAVAAGVSLSVGDIETAAPVVESTTVSNKPLPTTTTLMATGAVCTEVSTLSAVLVASLEECAQQYSDMLYLSYSPDEGRCEGTSECLKAPIEEAHQSWSVYKASYVELDCTATLVSSESTCNDINDENTFAVADIDECMQMFDHMPYISYIASSSKCMGYNSCTEIDTENDWAVYTVMCVDPIDVLPATAPLAPITTPEPTTTTELETTEAASPCDDYEKKPCRKEHGDECMWSKVLKQCVSKDWVPVCSDFTSNKKNCKRIGKEGYNCEWSAKECQATDAACVAGWIEVELLKKKDTKTKHLDIENIEDCIAKSTEAAAKGLIYEPISKKCFTFKTVQDYHPGTSADTDEVVYFNETC